MAQNKVPFRKWVPKWLRAFIGLIILVPIMMINGAYTGCSVDISGALGVLSEDISMGYYAASAGMAVAYPIIPKIRSVVTTKTVLLAGLLLQVLLSLLCASVSSMKIIIAASFFIGLFKAFSLMEMIIIMKPIFSPNNVRSEFYAYFYPIVFGLGQISMITTAELAYNYQWQYMYYFVVVMLLVAIALVLIFFRYGTRKIVIPYKEIDWRSLFLACAILLLSIYICVYGKTKDWFTPSEIVLFTVLITSMLYFFIKRQNDSDNPYIHLDVWKSKKAITGYFFMTITMILSASSTLISSYTTSVLKLNSIYSNGLNLFMLPGFVLGGFICFWWMRWQIWRFRVLVSLGMLCFVCYFALIYFGLTPEGTYEFLWLPLFFRGMGMMILFIAFGVFVVEDLNPKFMISNAFFLVSLRSSLAPVIGASLFSNLIYRGQQQANMILSETIDMQNTISAARYNDALQSAVSQGNPSIEAEQLAINNIYSTLTAQSTMVTIKTIAGYLLIFSIVVMIISRFTPFHKTIKVRVVRSGDDMA